MRPRKDHRQHKPKDVLVLALKNLWVGEELSCTAWSYARIKDRLDAFSISHDYMSIAVIPKGNIRKIRRTM